MLAWGHSRVIENLMLQRHRMYPPPVRAISDQFAHDKATVARALMTEQRLYGLVLGSDYEDNTRHSDTIMFISYDPQGRFLDDLSIPRDTQIAVPVPNGASSGPVVVTTAGIASNALNYYGDFRGQPPSFNAMLSLLAFPP